jgi:tRNA G18 (ribose-2'-O)-methylase SpoU
MVKRNNGNRGGMWIYGKHAVKAALKNSRRIILRLVALNSRRDFLLECCELSITPEIVDDVFF